MQSDLIGSSNSSRIPVRLHRKVSLIHTEDSILAQELLANEKLSGAVLGKLTDCALLVRPGAVESVIQELQKIGHTPRVVTSGPTD